MKPGADFRTGTPYPILGYTPEGIAVFRYPEPHLLPIPGEAWIDNSELYISGWRFPLLMRKSFLSWFLQVIVHWQSGPDELKALGLGLLDALERKMRERTIVEPVQEP